MIGVGLAIAAGAVYVAILLTTQSGTNVPEALRPGAADGYNVLVITLEAIRADRLGCYGYPHAETPVLDDLASEGLRFHDAVSPVPMTAPALASIFTGLDPDHHGVRADVEFRLPDSHATLAEVLEQHGYETAAFVSTFALDARFGLNQGFALYNSATKLKTDSTFVQFNSRTATEVTEEALTWLRERNADRSFFVWVHYSDAHEPYNPPDPFAERFSGAPYNGEIAYVDFQIGRLLRRLDRSGVRDRTLILVVGNYGEGLGEHDERTHSLLIYDATQRVPLILACQGLFRTAHVVDDVVVSITDVLPTVLALLGIAETEPTDGISLLLAHNGRDRAVYMETLQPLFEHGWSPLYGLRRHTDKFILAPRPEYYDLRTDPQELHNLYAVSRDPAKARLADLKSELEKRIAEDRYAERVASGKLDPKAMMPTWEIIVAGHAMLDTGDVQGALTKAEAARALSPDDRSVLRLVGQCHAQMGAFAEASEAFRAFIDIKPSADICVLLAQVTMAQGNYAEAESLLEQAAELDPKHGGVYIGRGDLHMMQGRYQEALADFEKAERVDPYRATGMARGRLDVAREVISSRD